MSYFWTTQNRSNKYKHKNKHIFKATIKSLGSPENIRNSSHKIIYRLEGTNLHSHYILKIVTT